MANSQHEPTMEEILASIRKIISDDASAAPATPAASPPEPKPAEPEVLDLTHEVAEVEVKPAVTSPAVETTSEESHPTPQGETTAEPIPEAAPAPPPDEGIFSEKARQVLSDALASIPETPAPPAEETHVETHIAAVAGIAGLSVEAVFERAVKESFDPVLQKWLSENNEALVNRVKPVIRDWLDENLPQLLEDAIRRELARAKPRTRR